MGKITKRLKVSFTGTFVIDTDDVMEVLEVAIERLVVGDGDKAATQMAKRIVSAAYEKGLDGVVEVLVAVGIRRVIKRSDDFDDIVKKSPATITFLN